MIFLKKKRVRQGSFSRWRPFMVSCAPGVPVKRGSDFPLIWAILLKIFLPAGDPMSFRRFEMHQYRQILSRMRLDETDRAHVFKLIDVVPHTVNSRSRLNRQSPDADRRFFSGLTGSLLWGFFEASLGIRILLFDFLHHCPLHDGVSRYFCNRLVGLSGGIVYSMNPASRAA